MTAAHEATRQAARDLAEALTYFADAEQRLYDSNPAFPGAASYDGPGGRSANTDTHPERHALNPDPTQFDRDLFAKLTRSLPRDAHSLVLLIEAWRGGKAPTVKQRAEVDRLNNVDECEHHRLAGLFMPVAHEGNPGKNLDVPMKLCSYCYDQTRRNGRLPTGEMMEKHHRTLKDDKVRTA